VRLPAALLATALLGTLTACATIGQDAALREARPSGPTASAPPALPAPTSAPSSTAPSSTAPAGDGAAVGTPAQARRKLARGIRTLEHEPTTEFEVTTTFDGQVVQDVDGFSTPSDSWQATTTFTTPGDPSDERVMEAKSLDGSVWMQMRDWPADQARCWLPMPTGYVPGGVQALMPYEPTYVSALDSLTATGFAGDATESTIKADLPVALVLTFLSTTVIDRIDGDAAYAVDDRMEVIVDVTSTRVIGYHVEGKAFARALTRAGVDLPFAVHAYLDESEFSVSFKWWDNRFAHPDVTAPPERLVASDDSETCPTTLGASTSL
jgi:hypothetical protein